LFFISEELFAFVFGERWRDAGKYAAVLTPLFFVRFIVSTVSMMNVIFEKNHVGFYWQLALMLLSIGTIIFSYIKQLSFINYLYLASVIISFHYLALLLIMASYNKIPKNKA
jgi:O-antigen/teichoic acid export membrane protein